jgi:D-glycero-beta-D-manno-heptose 1-phosphate adenylyltransferase
MSENILAPIFDFRLAGSRADLNHWRNVIELDQSKLVFSNGVFDILHRGHVEYLSQARELGDKLIVGLNTDASVKRLKGEHRPIQPEADRAYILASLKCIDAVVYFEEDTPLELIRFLLPDILVKGSDYMVDTIVGSDVVLSRGGQVKTIELVEGRSTSNAIDTILERYGSR